jgi:hypothetical protein
MQAINLYGERPYLQPELQEARDFVQATEHSKQLTNAFRGDLQKYWDELESARRKLQVCTYIWVMIVDTFLPVPFLHYAWSIPPEPVWQQRPACLAPVIRLQNMCGGVTGCPDIEGQQLVEAESWRRSGLPMQELACVDLSMEIAERCLEVVRSSIEAAAARERDEAAARLLSELELEDASKKVSCCGTGPSCHSIPSLAPQLLLSAVMHTCVGGVD